MDKNSTVCKVNQCCGCMVCIDVCNKKAINIYDTMKAYNAVIDTKKCINCGACHNACPQNHSASAQKPIKWLQGWSKDIIIRENGSSGGIAGAIARTFISNGGTVCSCEFKDGKFQFEFATNEQQVVHFSGSKYVKSNPFGIYKKIRARLVKGERVLFIGLPCQVAALKKYIRGSLQDNLYTVDLICHGTPSPKLLEIFLGQYDCRLEDMRNVRFRVKGKFQILNENESIVTKGVTDKYMIAFLNSLIYTDNCYNCQYAKTERISDVTLGDSWGSTLSTDEVKKGISLILVQSDKGSSLLENTDLNLQSVDIENAIRHNQQLYRPSKQPKGRKKFFEDIKKGRTFNKLVFYNFPKACLKQDVKKVLMLLGIRKSKREDAL